MTCKTLKDWLESYDKPNLLIGKSVRYGGVYYEIIDFLAEENTLVLGSQQDETVQEDRYGRAHRLVPKTEMIRLNDESGQQSHVCENITLLFD